MKAIFVVGKGGVGKTTCAAATAVSLSKKYDILIVSLDPAHNLGDVFGSSLSGKAKNIGSKLWAMEVDMERAIRDYLEESARKLKGMYGYLKAINIEGYLDTIRLSPGIEEYATLEEMEKIISEGEGRYEVIVFDTPPTGLTLRVLALPKISLIWGERLVKLRKDILSKRLAIEKIEGEKRFVLEGREFKLSTREEKDEVMRELLTYMSEVGKVKELQTDSRRTAVMPVMNADRLSLFETKRALDTLASLAMPIGAIVVNKFGGKEEENALVAKAEKELGKPIRKIPLLEEEPVGMDAIEQFSVFLKAEEWLPRG
ncbi:MAG: ArsA family ATPase [Dehalococcoidia bacterium]|nr:ArsA family ATPase [Dehalococcoidia bacterium]